MCFGNTNLLYILSYWRAFTHEKDLFCDAMIEGADKSAHNDCIKLLEIVDSQAQKIADLNRVGSNTLLALIEAQEKIAEQAKEIDRLKQRIQGEYDAKAGF